MIRVSDHDFPTHPTMVGATDDQTHTCEALTPVVNTLLYAARRQGAALQSAGERDARSYLAAAKASAEAHLAAARAEGTETAERVAASQLAASRRQARQLVLSARRRARHELRTRSAALVRQKSSTAAGQALLGHLMALASDRAGTDAVTRRDDEGEWVIVAESGARRAELDIGGLIDQFMPSFAARVDTL
jgi:hypothetical protein